MNKKEEFTVCPCCFSVYQKQLEAANKKKKSSDVK